MHYADSGLVCPSVHLCFPYFSIGKPVIWFTLVTFIENKRIKTWFVGSIFLISLYLCPQKQCSEPACRCFCLSFQEGGPEERKVRATQGIPLPNGKRSARVSWCRRKEPPCSMRGKGEKVG